MGYAQVMGMADEIRDIIKARVCTEAKAGGEGCKANFGKGLTEAMGKISKSHAPHNIKTDLATLSGLVKTFFSHGISSVARSASRFMGLYDTYQRDGVISGVVSPASANPLPGAGVVLANVSGTFKMTL